MNRSLDFDALDILPPDEEAAARARARWDAIAKPLGSLGVLEDAVVKIAALTGSDRVDIARRCVVVLCADNGVVAEGVAQSGHEVTFAVARAIAEGTSSVCRMCAPQGIDCHAVDMGMAEHQPIAGLWDRRIAAGTQSIAKGPAMTREQAVQAIQTGIDLVGALATPAENTLGHGLRQHINARPAPKEAFSAHVERAAHTKEEASRSAATSLGQSAQGYRLIACGEMGIGNTTTATAMACAFLQRDPEGLVGRGAGLSDEGLARKTAAIRQALAINAPDPNDPLDVLAKLGGFDIAGLVGLYLGGALYRVPLLIDGLVGTVAAYCALELCPACRCALLASHVSAEPASRLLLDRMGLRPVIDAGLHLGEGTGAACLIPLLDMALALYRDGDSFEQRGIRAYKPFTAGAR